MAGDPYLWDALDKHVVKSDWLSATRQQFTKHACMTTDGDLFLTIQGDRRLRLWETATAWPVWVSPPAPSELHMTRGRFKDGDSAMEVICGWNNDHVYEKLMPAQGSAADAADAVTVHAGHLINSDGGEITFSSDEVFRVWSEGVRTRR
jgi:hypothetical protein